MLQLIFYYFYQITRTFYFKVCNIFLRCSFWFLGALTSKPFAYKARSWELVSSYIADITNIHCEKLRVDSKGLEIVRVLPWLNSNLSENWITDKSWFFYDGLALNWISKFFLKKKFLLFPLIILTFHFLDPLFIKYFSKEKNIEFFKKISSFKNSKNNFYNFFFELFDNFNFFKKLFFNTISSKNNFDKNQNYFNKSWVKRYYLLGNFYFFHKNENLFYFLNKFSFLWKNLFLNFKKFSDISINKFYWNIFLNILNPTIFKKFHFFLNIDLDLLNLIFVNKFKTNFFNFKFNLSKINLFLIKKNKFIFNYEFENLNKIDLFILINTNIWLTNPKFHVQLKWLIKYSQSLIINIGNHDDLLFKNLNFGSNLIVLNNFLNARHWVNSFFKKKSNIAFFLNLNLNQLIFDNLNFFSPTLLKNNLPIIKYYYSGNSLLYNQYFFIKSLALKKKIILKQFSNLKTNLISSNFCIYSSFLTITNNFFLSKKNFIKKNYFFLLESNLNDLKISYLWDFIFPLTIISENFFQFKNLKNLLTNSLLVKFGPWNGRNLFTYLNFFLLIDKFPFFWLSTNVYFFFEINFLFLNYWLYNYLTNKFKKITNFVTINFYSNICIKKQNLKFNTNNFFCFINRNFWKNQLSYLNNSWYNTIGVSLLKKEFKTYLN